MQCDLYYEIVLLSKNKI